MYVENNRFVYIFCFNYRFQKTKLSNFQWTEQAHPKFSDLFVLSATKEVEVSRTSQRQIHQTLPTNIPNTFSPSLPFPPHHIFPFQQLDYTLQNTNKLITTILNLYSGVFFRNSNYFCNCLWGIDKEFM